MRQFLEYLAETLVRAAGPADPRRLREPVHRAEVRAAGDELRHLQELLGETVRRMRWREGVQKEKGEPVDPAERRFCDWLEEQRREIMRLAVRFERKVGPPPL